MEKDTSLIGRYRPERGRKAQEPGGQECHECGCTFLGAEWHSLCSVCEAAREQAKVPNRPTPEGRMLGEQLARLTEKTFELLRAKFPDHAEPCQSCAFRRGTVPNGCVPTVMDAIKCVMEGRDFMCHQHRDENGECDRLCNGYLIAMSANDGRGKPMETPWPYSE